MAANERLTPAELRRIRNDEQGKASTVTRLLFDEDTFSETSVFMKNGEGNFETVVTGYGAVDNRLVYTFIEDGSRDGGGFGQGSAKKICSLLSLAQTNMAPVVGVFDSKGAYVSQGVDMLAAYGDVIKCVKAAKNRVPMIAVINGSCPGASAVVARMFDVVVMAGAEASIYVNSPFITGKTDQSESESCDIRAESLDDAIVIAKRILAYLPSAAGHYTINSPEADDPNRATPELADILSKPDYSAEDVIKVLADAGEYTCAGKGFADELLCGFMRMYGISVGYIISNPAVNGGALTVRAAQKAVRMVSMCGRLGIGLLTLVDTSGYKCDAENEKLGYAESLAALAESYLDYKNIKVTAIIGRAYGSAFTVFGSKSVGADVVIAADGAKIAAMSPESAVQFLYFDKIKQSEDPAKARAQYMAEYSASVSALEAAKNGEVDDVVAYDELRVKIIAAFEMLSFRL